MEISLARPLLNGVGRVSQWFGEHPEWYKKYGHAGHSGLDYAAPLGTLVMAAHAGKITVGLDPQGYGNFVRVTNQYYETIYAHLSRVLVSNGMTVEKGEDIGEVGSTGNSTGPHLHWGLRVKGMRNPAYGGYIDPVVFRVG